MRVKRFALPAALTVLVCAWLLVLATRVSTPCEDYEEKLQAAERTQTCIQAIHDLKQEMGVAINTASDINDTGVIGQDFSLITTTLGELAVVTLMIRLLQIVLL